jgi:DNA polymerase
VKLVPDQYGEKIEVYNAMEHKWEHTWGGTLTENIVQAFCRDILMEAMLRLDALGYRTVHRIHDELVICVPEAEGPAVLKIAEREMSVTPKWAPGLPLGAEAKLSRFYCKN